MPIGMAYVYNHRGHADGEQPVLSMARAASDLIMVWFRYSTSAPSATGIHIQIPGAW